MSNWLPKCKVLVPVDFSDQSLAAIGTALAMVEEASHLNILHVLPVLSPTEPGVIWDALDDAERCQQVEQSLRERLPDAKFAGIEIAVLVGDPGHEIADHAEKIGAELIVMPSHGRTGIQRLLIGSVAERVVRLAHCPVLVLRK